jgi:uncharacterized protein (TIGR02996 family)
VTDEEALSLRPGDRVMTRINGRRAAARVTAAPLAWGGRDVVIPLRREEGVNAAGRRCPQMRHPARKVTSLTGRNDPATANVFADWLEERGEHRAADLLRAAFPMCLQDREP